MVKCDLGSTRTSQIPFRWRPIFGYPSRSFNTCCRRAGRVAADIGKPRADHQTEKSKDVPLLAKAATANLRLLNGDGGSATPEFRRCGALIVGLV